MIQPQTSSKVPTTKQFFNIETAKFPTGINGLDEVLEGGLPIGRSILITGGPGDGKTVFLGEFLYQGISKYNQNGLFVTFEEKPSDIIRNFQNFNWKYAEFIDQQKLMFIDASPSSISIEEISAFYNLSPLIERIKYAVRKIKAERVVIDGIRFLFEKFSNQKIVRETLYNIANELKSMGVIVVISNEKSDLNPLVNSVEEFVADGVIELNRHETGSEIQRTMTIKKLRGAYYQSKKVSYEITNQGISVFPKIQNFIKANTKKPFQKMKFGIPVLDKALNGGVNQGYVTFLAGDLGTGKTILGQHFLMEGVKNKENGLYVTLDEPISQIKNNALTRGWDLTKLEKNQKISFIAKPTNETNLDSFLYKILTELKKSHSQRLLFDSASTLLLHHNNASSIDFLTQLISYCKSNNITSIFNYLVTPGDYSGAQQLNFLTDALIYMRYNPDQGTSKNSLLVFKLRGSDHSKLNHKYKITKQSFVFDAMKEKE